MASTQTYVLDTDEWVLVSENNSTVAIQPQDQGLFMVYFSDTTEPDDATRGFLIGRGARDVPTDFSAAGLPEDIRVWAKVYDTADPVTIVVAAY